MLDDQRFASTRPDVLVYQTEPLEHDMTIAGPLEASLYVSTTGTDADWVVKLIDVYPPDFPDPSPNPTRIRMGGYQQLVRGEPFRGKFELLRQQFPGESNGFVLEVIAKGEVPQHFEECLVAPRVAHVVEVVVLSPGSYNLLTCCRPVIGACFTAQEHFLELIHSRVDEQQRRILSRNQGGTSHDGVTTIFEVLEKTTTNFITVHEVVPIPLVYRPREILNGLKGEKDGTRPVSQVAGAIAERAF